MEEAIGPLKAVVPAARWTSPVTWHVTLKFFGEVPDQWLAGIQEGIGLSVVGTQPITSRLLDIGAFPDPNRARVLWVGIGDPEGALSGLAERINRDCQFTEDRPLHPHVTLARLRSPAKVGPLFDRFRPLGFEPSSFLIEQVTLYRSYTERTGSRYEVLGEWKLPGPDPGEPIITGV